MNQIANHTARLLGVESVKLAHFSSGDLSALMRAVTDDGQSYIVKTGPAPALEAEMLRLIAATGAPAPAVIAADDTLLIMEEVEGRSGFSDAEDDLARVLTALHRPVHRPYGFNADFSFGKVAIRNDETASWVAFWRDNRLLNNLADLPTPLASRVEGLAARLGDIIPDNPPPALLHGDLWSGNVMTSGGRVTALIDPACYYGDREVDLAMAHLFGHLDDRFYARYGALDPGLETRRAVYSLWPALVHFRLFGSGYRAMVEGFLTEAGH
ncbi:fructosamine kinase family protein [Martelella sp. AMO21009]